MKMIFIGDSITASGKNADPERLGNGYVRMIKEELSQNVNILNKGVNGHRVTDLAIRWERDVINLEPDLVSISIGINDVWRQLDSPDLNQVDVEKFEQIYRDLLSQLTQNNSVKVVLMEPTIIEENPESKGNQMLIPYVETVRKLANECGAWVVPTHDVFMEHLKSYPEMTLTTDGVHMNKKGNLLMAQTWLKETKDLLADYF
ncbi:SGNH/GDSL hydrolase family protein [Fictibacillus nanhaiensis]|uniref:SGNH/GDSL hydrolase family protein n=1 Tax=Fictibacillus nanhaiensis TaxID=742169 RepID=UPI001C9842B9|nr:SGNH/GDSL hydrolase family protein [Fictibacillus nanhaiensis]MBY6037301.1 SGNH/GDSL hydrolase family protein [Fictibacillus nanhaiensis]